MDGNDFYDYFVHPLLQLNNTKLAKLADKTLPADWFMTQKGRDDTADRIALVIHDDYFNTGAADHWGPRTFFDYWMDTI